MAGSGISRDEALAMLEERLSNLNLRRHCMAAGAIMRSLAEDRGEDPELWEVTGILHDLDYEETAGDHSMHGVVTARTLEGRLPREHVHAILSHNAENNGSRRESDLDHLLAAAECVTGLITATALIYPDRSLASVEPSSVIKRMTKSGFARAVNRDGIMECRLAGYDLDRFMDLSLRAMKSISGALGL